MRLATFFLFAMTSATFTLSIAHGQQNVKPLLEHTIVSSVLPMAEVQRFCEDRVPRLRTPKKVGQWKAEAERLRSAVLEKIVFRGEAAKWRDAKTNVQWLETIDGGPGYRIKKLRYEALPGMWIPALLYEPEHLSGKVPVILNVNGHSAEGKQYPPKQIRCINQAKRGMLALNVEWLGMGQLRTDGFSHARMNQLDLCGTSGLAPYYLNMKRALDILLSLKNADPSRVAVTGLSGGGWQTIFISSLDLRVTLANPVAGYSSFRTRARHLKDLGDSEQTPNDLATLVDYTHLTAMRAPRPTLLTYNSKDNCCFESVYALKPLLDAASPIYQLFGKPDALRSHVNDDPGTHNFEVDNRQSLYRMIGDFFFPGDKTYNGNEIPSNDEVKSKQQLHIELPKNNMDFHTLAVALGRKLPVNPSLPTNEKAAARWQADGRDRLRSLVRATQYTVDAVKPDKETKDPISALYWRLQLNGDWTVPAVELWQGAPTKTAIVVADGGRKTAANEVSRLLASGYRVIAMDPFYFGESKIEKRDYLFALLVAGVGQRPLGIQASQVAAIARWAVKRHADSPVTVVALGPRGSLFSLVAAALERKAIAGVQLHGSLSSLKEIIQQNWTVSQKPELFCFGLLKSFDIKQLAALVAPRPVTFVSANEHVQKEMKGLRQWYQLLGREFDPLATR